MPEKMIFSYWCFTIKGVRVEARCHRLGHFVILSPGCPTSWSQEILLLFSMVALRRARGVGRIDLN